MKKQHFPLLISITAIFAAFLLGFFLGRNANHSPVQLSIPEAAPAALTQTAHSEPQTLEQANSLHTGPIAPEDNKPATEATQFIDSLSSDGKVNINTAGHAELMTLPGIGEVIAQRIIDYRTAYGPFSTAESLKNVSGIGDKKLEAIIDLITVGG